MKKPSLLYASPFPPMKSGISDYSVVLVKALAEAFDITLYTDDYVISEPTLDGFPVLKYGSDHVDFDAFDYRIYNMGNQPDFHSYIYEAALEHPGMVILHDFILYYLFVGYYQNQGSLYSNTYMQAGLNDFLTLKDAVRRSPVPLLAQKQMAEKLPLNRELLKSDNLFMVHSQYTYDRVLETGLVKSSQIRKINHIALLDEEEPILAKQKLFKKYRIPKDALVIAAFGYIAQTKLNRETAQAVKRLSKRVNRKICYVMVGDGNYVDDLLEDELIIKTGYTELDEFNSMVDYADIIVNLRNPSLGETSGSMLRILQKGKPCITNNGGWFSEIPDDCVCKIGLDLIEDNIEKAIRHLTEDGDDRRRISEAAQRYVEEECGARIIRGHICAFLKSSIG